MPDGPKNYAWQLSGRVQQGLGPRLSLDNPAHHSPWYLVAPWYYQVPRVPGVGKSEPHEPRGVQLFLEFPPNMSDFPAKFGSLNVKIRNYMENIICIPCKWSNHVNNKSRPCKYHATPLKRNYFLVKFMISAVLSPFQICRNLRAFSLPSTWSSSILCSPSLPLKPSLTLCHPLLSGIISGIVSEIPKIMHDKIMLNRTTTYQLVATWE